MVMPADKEANSNTQTNVGAWSRAAFVGGTKNDDPNWYKAKLASNKSYTLKGDTAYGRRAAVVGFWTETDSNESITWDPDGGATLFDDVNGVNYNNYNNSKANFTKNIQDQSQWMYNMTSTGTVTVRDTENGSYHWRNKYNNDKIQYKFEYNDTHKEKVLVFTGNGTSHMQVFNLNASLLNSTGYSGISYDFRNLPSGASIVINIVDDKGKPYDGGIAYHNGWQFWWTPSANADTPVSNLTEIGNGYFDNAPPTSKKAYSVASQAIMWNFGKTENLTIYGGMYNGQTDNGKYSVADIDDDTSQQGDDPAAAMLGSIMVPHGSFDDHVTTNGRVWVGDDFMMNNPVAPFSSNNGVNFTDGKSASIIDMDQERHNFSWHGSLSTSCSTIDWTKVGENKDPNTGENVPLGGTTWAVYNNLDAAKANSTTMATNTGNDANPNFTAGRLFTVTDNISSSGDLNPIAGAFQLQKLLPDANYYIRETATNNNAYKVNPNIYQFQTKNRGTTTNTFVRVLDAQGTPINNAEDKLITSNGSIINPLNSSSIEWGKTKQGEFAGLDGSEWVLTKTGTPQQQWLIEDDGKPIESLKIYDGEQEAPDYKTVTQGQPFNLSAVVLPAEANQHVDWTADPNKGVSISSSDNGRSVEIVAQKIPPAGGNFLLTAIAADGMHQDSITIHVDPVEVKSITVTPQEPTVMKGDTLQLAAKVIGMDDKELSLAPEWVSNNEDIATVDPTGKVTGVDTGPVTITATAGNKTATTTVTVLDGTRIYVDAPAANWGDKTYLYYWGDGLTKPDWPGKEMKKLSNGLYFMLVPTKTAFKVIVDCGGDGCKTADTDISASSTKNTFKLTVDKDKKVTIDDTYVPDPQATPVSTQSNAPRKAKAARAGDTTPTWSHIDTTGWGDDKKLKDQNPNIGQFKLDGLSAGTYYLQENKAPDGYFINPTVYTITIGENGSITWSPEPAKDSNGLHWISDVPTEFSWDKVDAGYFEGDLNATNNPIADSEWKLQKFQNGTYVDEGSEITDCVANAASGCTGTDKDHRAGKFKLTGLALGKYRLKETAAPEGYQTPTNVYYYFELSTKTPGDTTSVKWTKGTGAFDDTTGAPTSATTASDTNSERSVQETKAPNYRQTGSVSWTKVDAEDTTKVLGGSEWTIKFKAEGTSQYGAEYKIVDCTSGDCAVPSGTTQPGWTYDRDPAVGKFKLENLQWGDYEFYESKAPDGYNLSTETYTFTVSKGNVNATIAITGTGVNDNRIPNEPGFELPSTGGEGNTLIVLFGFALIAISLVGGAITMRKRI
ncbi:SpaA isopeptide-forming pilin-related protein [Bifidobacterium pseudolongum]|uniref:SpaA isopeptide-forming pilin-related protein n=1 Tax=Bifidobacterium pseudolongum TaxID=1694 RepID=UPI0010228EE1|nr:SpaA isopeptide-forming pilin-related protein [Bifidobacterium pseudolongum]